jgi:hypothetical protein
MSALGTNRAEVWLRLLLLLLVLLRRSLLVLLRRAGLLLLLLLVLLLLLRVLLVLRLLVLLLLRRPRLLLSHDRTRVNKGGLRWTSRASGRAGTRPTAPSPPATATATATTITAAAIAATGTCRTIVLVHFEKMAQNAKKKPKRCTASLPSTTTILCSRDPG